jgi:hypothetical protein
MRITPSEIPLTHFPQPGDREEFAVDASAPIHFLRKNIREEQNGMIALSA